MSKSTYVEKLTDPRWQRKRLEILERDKFACRTCGCVDSTLHVHHIHYFPGNPWNTPNLFLLTVCEDCHTGRQNMEKEAKQWLSTILAKLPYCTDDHDRMMVFLESLKAQSELEDENLYPVLAGFFDNDWDADIRWYNYAVAHPEFRTAYDDVMGVKVKWDIIDSRQIEK